MTSFAIGQQLPSLSLEPDTMGIIVGNVGTFDFFPGLIDPDFARSVGHKSAFMNTMVQLSLMDRFALEAMPEGRIRSHELTMRKPIYGGMALEVTGTVTGSAPFAGSKLAGPGTEYQIDLEIRVGADVHTKGKVSVVVP